MKLDKADIYALLPHAGSMCLIDEVISWDDTGILCRARLHKHPDNPLRDKQGLAAINGVEYAAQALALQAALAAGEAQTAGSGYLVAIKDLSWNLRLLDEAGGALQIEATVLMRSETAMIGAFELMVSGRSLMRGRLTVMNGG